MKYLWLLSKWTFLSGESSGNSSSRTSSCSVVLCVSVTILPSGLTELNSRVSSVSVTLFVREVSFIKRGLVETMTLLASFVRNNGLKSFFPVCTADKNCY